MTAGTRPNQEIWLLEHALNILQSVRCEIRPRFRYGQSVISEVTILAPHTIKKRAHQELWFCAQHADDTSQRRACRQLPQYCCLLAAGRVALQTGTVSSSVMHWHLLHPILTPYPPLLLHYITRRTAWKEIFSVYASLRPQGSLARNQPELLHNALTQSKCFCQAEQEIYFAKS